MKAFEIHRHRHYPAPAGEGGHWIRICVGVVLADSKAQAVKEVTALGYPLAKAGDADWYEVWAGVEILNKVPA